MSKTITLSDLEIATAVAALRVVAANSPHGGEVWNQLIALAQKLQEPVAKPSEKRCAFCGAVVVNGHCTDPVGHTLKEYAQGDE